jgi:hypothetical protein
MDQELLTDTQASECVSVGQEKVKRVGRSPSKTAGEKIAADMAVFQSVASELRLKAIPTGTTEERCRVVCALASELFGVSPTWTAFYREVFGRDGLIRALFNSADDQLAYEESEAPDQLLEMLTVLRSRDLPENDPTEAQRMITIRLPLSLHNVICDEANELEVSVNKLCISRMLQPLDSRMIPNCSKKRRGRRPGAPVLGKPATEEAVVEDEAA